jgi:hypothetical protein
MSQQATPLLAANEPLSAAQIPVSAMGEGARPGEQHAGMTMQALPAAAQFERARALQRYLVGYESQAGAYVVFPTYT